MKKITLILLVAFISSFTLYADIWDEISSTALAPNTGTSGRALPLAATWEDGFTKYSSGEPYATGIYFEPSYIIELIEKNHHLLVNFNHLAPGRSANCYSWYSDYMEDALDYLEEKNQPFCIGMPIYERYLYVEEPYISLPSSTSPRVYTTSQELLDELTPFAPDLDKWYDVGENWVGDNYCMDMLQSIYPNPPKVIFLDDNEAEKLNWPDAEDSQRYIDLYGTGQSDVFKREVFAEGWTDCYDEMFDGMRAGLNANWLSNSIFIGYGCGGQWRAFGRWSNWINHSLHYDSKITWEQDAWDGSSINYYIDKDSAPPNGYTDYQVMGMQVAAQNRVFMLEDQLSDNSEFWHEMSTWAGGDDLRDYLVNTLGQTYDDARYKGFVQFGMFLLTPRVVRFFDWPPPYNEDKLSFFNAVVEAVDRVHTDSVLKRFWQYSELVENTSRSHPYQTAVPTEFASQPRWFQLNTNLDPATPWSLTTEIPVFALARVIGETPNREWLVYAHSPLQARSNVQITLPGYGTVTTDVSREGTFVLLKENNNDLMAYYSLNSTADDLSGNDNDGTLINSPSYSIAKISNGISLSRTSSQYINCGNDASLNGNDELTISIWAKADSLEASGYNWILGKGSLIGSTSGYSLRCYNGGLKFYIVGLGGTIKSVIGPTLDEDVWYHIVGVFKGGEYIKLYVNGTEYSNTTSIPSTIEASSSYDLHIGNASYCSYPWDGIIDEVKIFNRILSSKEITDEGHCLLELSFEEIDSNTVADLSRNNNSGTLVNNPALTSERTAGNNAILLVKSGSQYVNCGNDASLNGNDELTIDLWVKADSLEASGYNWILGKGSLIGSTSGYSLRCYNGGLKFYIVGLGGAIKSVIGPTLDEDVWYHIVGVFKGGEYIKLYVNGTEYSNTTSIPSTIEASSSYDLHIGNASYCNYPWDGIIDEVKIFNKALY